MSTYLWIEDRENKSGYVFWKTIMKCIYPNIIVQSKRNNINLIKSVKKLNKKDIDINKYIIVIDNSFDNNQIVREIKKLKTEISNRDNIYLLNIISFEYILLSFTYLIDWIYAEKDEFRVKRKKEMYARKAIIQSIENGIEYKNLSILKEIVTDVDSYNIEQLVTKLLFKLTRNTGFEVTKGALGECWRVDCCNYSLKHDDDLCGLEINKLTKEEKANAIYFNSILNSQFENIPLEVLV